MYKILRKKELASNICLMEIEAPRIACSALPGQFLIVRLGEFGERIPLTICDYNKQKGSITIVIQAIGFSSTKMCALKEGDSFDDVAGPLGNQSAFVNMSNDALKSKKYLFIAGGVGTAPVYPQVKYLKERGAHVDVIMGAKTADLLIMENEISSCCSNLYECTDDGSKGFHGLVTQKMKDLIEGGNNYDEIVAIGPMIMMKFVTLTAKSFNIPLTVSLNTLMVDGTGMCGACRVSVGGKTKFACVDGPEFDGYQVDFDEALRRLTIYKEQEKEAMVTGHPNAKKIHDCYCQHAK